MNDWKLLVHVSLEAGVGCDQKLHLVRSRGGLQRQEAFSNDTFHFYLCTNIGYRK